MSKSPSPGERPVRSIDPKSLSKHFEAVDVEQRWDRTWQESGVYDLCIFNTIEPGERAHTRKK